jgi:hypothetical protein
MNNTRLLTHGYCYARLGGRLAMMPMKIEAVEDMPCCLVCYSNSSDIYFLNGQDFLSFQQIKRNPQIQYCSLFSNCGLYGNKGRGVSHRVPTLTPLPSSTRGKAGRNHLNEEITPLLPAGIGERFSQTVSNLGHAALMSR